jgi:glucan phosphoethanolaminetransferase (alkaline phosphatase superfamily)
VLGYALYLVQAMLLLIWRVAAEYNQRLWFNVASFFLYSVMMLIFVVAALQSAGLPPFSY